MAKTYVLYGVAERDHNELVCMFFAKKKHAARFVKYLPGKYHIMRVGGVDHDALETGRVKEFA